MLIDSNILIYSINFSSPKHARSQEFLQNNINSLEIAHQNIFETLRILTHPKFKSHMEINTAIEAVANILEFSKIISPDYRTHHSAFDLIKKYKLTADQIFDSYLAATALSNNIDTIATDNIKDFQKIKELKIVNPFNTT